MQRHETLLVVVRIIFSLDEDVGSACVVPTLRIKVLIANNRLGTYDEELFAFIIPFTCFN